MDTSQTSNGVFIKKYDDYMDLFHGDSEHSVVVYSETKEFIPLFLP